jgi:hypothetical protein
MSRINDALKQAQKNQTPAPGQPAAPPPIRMSPMPPVATQSAPKNSWLMPVVVILFLVGAVATVGWMMTRRSPQHAITIPQQANAATVTTVATPTANTVQPATAATATANVTPAPALEPELVTEVSPGSLPKLQGIFYSPTSPSAIIDGTTVRLGDRLLQYRVKQINKTTVLLTGADGRTVQLMMR